MREVHQDETSQVELFLNSVPILASLTREEKMMLVDALEEQAYPPASRVINQVGAMLPSQNIHFLQACIHTCSSDLGVMTMLLVRLLRRNKLFPACCNGT